ncbi:MAG: hypothetical protein LBV16_03575 [Elusimicrobiota bacterium]|jgi:hypothetical protein|nr:hypothetical protein [Elusimicrobiota bacterium]
MNKERVSGGGRDVSALSLNKDKGNDHARNARTATTMAKTDKNECRDALCDENGFPTGTFGNDGVIDASIGNDDEMKRRRLRVLPAIVPSLER